MAGIIATSSSHTMTSGETSANNSTSGYVVGEQITLSTNPTGSEYAWAIGIPTDSGASRSALSDDEDDSPTFISDVGGIYVVSVTVDSTTAYTLICSVTDLVASTPHEA